MRRLAKLLPGVVLAALWLCVPWAYGLAPTPDNEQRINLLWGWQFDKTLSLQGMVIGVGLVWQVGRWGRKGVQHMADLAKNAREVPELALRLLAIEKWKVEARLLAIEKSVKALKCGNDEASCEAGLGMKD